ncbi:MAG: nitroreductase family protein [Mangrovibacterium sp.]
MKIPYKHNIIKFKLSLEKKIKQFISSNNFTITLFYFIRPGAYRFEKSVVIRSNLKHLDYKNFQSAHTYQLRRNIHRIEKGLSQKNQKKVFAGNYIEETIIIYEGYINSEHKKKDEAAYFNIVLDEYFAVVDRNPFLNKLFHRFTLAKSKYTDHISTNKPEKTDHYLDTDLKLIEDIVLKRHSIRFFTEKLVPDDLITKAIKVARNAPSGCNRQPFKYIVIANPKTAIEVSNISFGTTGFENLKQLIAVVTDHEAYFKEFDRHLGIIDASLSAMLLMIALTAEGISTCPINWPDIWEKQKAISSVINLKPNEQVVMLIAYGYAQEGIRIPLSTKKTPEQLSRFI